jgi:hypothetical protein
VEIRDLAQETIYIVQSFRAGRGTRLLADPPVACKSEPAARRTAERLAQSRVGVIAWSRTVTRNWETSTRSPSFSLDLDAYRRNSMSKHSCRPAVRSRRSWRSGGSRQTP